MTTIVVATVAQKFTVTGMTCSHCERAVTGELSKLDGVTRVAVDLATGIVITESVETLSLDAVGAGLGAAIGPDVAQPVAEAPAPIGQGVVAAVDGYRLIPASTTLDGD